MADIVDTAISAGNFKTLVAAVQAAGLVETLKSPGPFTVLLQQMKLSRNCLRTVENLLKDIPKLKSILTYHVVAGKVTSADVVKLKTAKTVEGEEVKIDSSMWHGHRMPKVNDAQIVQADIMTDNGVIHVIDKVLIPPMKMAH